MSALKQYKQKNLIKTEITSIYNDWVRKEMKTK